MIWTFAIGSVSDLMALLLRSMLSEGCWMFLVSSRRESGIEFFGVARFTATVLSLFVFRIA